MSIGSTCQFNVFAVGDGHAWGREVVEFCNLDQVDCCVPLFMYTYRNCIPLLLFVRGQAMWTFPPFRGTLGSHISRCLVHRCEQSVFTCTGPSACTMWWKGRQTLYNSQSECFPKATASVQDRRGVVKSSECEFIGWSFFCRVRMNVNRWEFVCFVFFVNRGVFSRLYFMKASCSVITSVTPCLWRLRTTFCVLQLRYLNKYPQRAKEREVQFVNIVSWYLVTKCFHNSLTFGRV